MYVLHKRGIKDNLWTIIDEKNSNLTARVQTKYGLTQEIKIKAIRQGGVSSGTLYTGTMNESNIEISKENLGFYSRMTTRMTSGSLGMDG